MLPPLLRLAVAATMIGLVSGFAVGAPAAPTTATQTAKQSVAFPRRGPLSEKLVGNGAWWRPTFTDEAIDKAFSDLERWGYKNIYVETFWDGETIFPSKLFPQKPGTQGRDWLAVMVAAGKRHGVRVHAWIHTFNWRYGQNRVAGHSLLGKHPDWIEVSRDSRETSGGDKRSVFVSPAHPEVRAALRTLVSEIAERGVDGVHLDYIRYSGDAEFGFNPVSVKRFQKATGIDPLKTNPKDLSSTGSFMKWVGFREDQVTAFVIEVQTLLKKLSAQKGHRIGLSAAFFPGYMESRGKNWKFQRWDVWVRNEFLDFSTPMCYAPGLPGLEKELKEVMFSHTYTRVSCIPGLAVGTFYSPHPTLKEQLPLVSKVGLPNWNVFKYETLRDDIAKDAEAGLAPATIAPKNIDPPSPAVAAKPAQSNRPSIQPTRRQRAIQRALKPTASSASTRMKSGKSGVWDGE